MESVKHGTATPSGRKRYSIPEVSVDFIRAGGVLCQSGGNGVLREHDFGDGGFGNDW